MQHLVKPVNTCIITTNYYHNDHLDIIIIIVVDSISRNERSSETQVEARKEYAI